MTNYEYEKQCGPTKAIGLLIAAALLALIAASPAFAEGCCDVDPATGQSAFGQDYSSGLDRERAYWFMREKNVRDNVRGLLGRDGERAYFGGGTSLHSDTVDRPAGGGGSFYMDAK